METIQMHQTQTSMFGFYFQTLTRILRGPRKFFGEDYALTNARQSLSFLLLSSFIFALFGILGKGHPNPFFILSILFVNAVGMTFISAALGYLVMVMIYGKQVPFSRFFGVYALASGVTLLASWVPFFIWLTEPWKWWLIGMGMIKGFGFRLSQAIIIIGVSVSTLIFLFCSIFYLLFS